MVATTVRQRMTVEEFARTIDDGKTELVDGEVWTMAAAGQRQGKYAHRLALDLGIHVREKRAGEVYEGEFGYVIRPDQATVLCPDVSFVTAVRVLPDNDDFYPGPPDIAVEVISPSETSRQVLAKVIRYLDAGTAIVWCVYPKERQVTVYAVDASPVTLVVGDTLTGGSVLPEFALPLSTLFGE